MSIPLAQPKYSFGLKGDVANNLSYLDEQNIIYPSGANLIILNVEQKAQKFIPCSVGSEGMTAMAVSPNKRFVAIAERKGEKPTIAIFDLTTLKRKKVLTSADSTSQEYVSLSFSPDSKYLASQMSGPEWVLSYWLWEKAKIMASTKSNGATNFAVRQVNECCICLQQYSLQLQELH